MNKGPPIAIRAVVVSNFPFHGMILILERHAKIIGCEIVMKTWKCDSSVQVTTVCCHSRRTFLELVFDVLALYFQGLIARDGNLWSKVKCDIF